MPYIRKLYRYDLEPFVTALAEHMQEMKGERSYLEYPGLLNYSITTLIKKVYGDDLSYADHNEIIGMLECVKQEWYRRQVAPYEDGKIEENGDV